MNTIYSADLKAHVSLDKENKVRHIRHKQEYWLSEQDIPRLAANDYLNAMAETLHIPAEELRHLSKKVSFLDPREQGIEYHLSEEKHFFDSATIGYYQTYMNVPVWRKGLSVNIKQSPNRVVGAINNSEDDIQGTLPGAQFVERYKRIFQLAAVQQATEKIGLKEEGKEREAETASLVRRVLGISAPRITAPPGTTARRRKGEQPQPDDSVRLLSGKFFVYKYDPAKRYGGKPAPQDEKKAQTGASLEGSEIPFPRLPPVSENIRSGQAYLVAELIFRYDLPGYHGLVWLALVELVTDSILYIECMTHGVNGLVFKRDPMVSSGNLAITSDQPNSVLDDHDFDEALNDLDPPAGGIQSLRGTYVVIQNEEAPPITPPTEPSGTDFDYPPRTDNFAAVNAYYHQTELFRIIEDLGFPIADYFDGTTFPIPVDHRGLGSVINAHWAPNGVGGTDHMCYALCDTTDLANPLGRAVDPWVHWHEMGGHGTLGDHVGSGVLGFSHSAGDGLAAIQMDSESALRALPERFRYAPFRPFTTERRFDRDVGTWAWGGANDDGSYGSEQILATCHFRIYRSIGGDSDDLNRRKFASRVVTYLILRTISNLTPATNPNDAEIWCEEMQDTDLEDWTSEGLSGGAYNKVIRWAFEKQGSYQPAGAPTPVTTAGAPPAVDVYINDGRNGEYPFQAVHWYNMSMWNRNSPDGLPGHQNAIEGATNYMYGKVKNRGTSPASNVTVRSFHSLPGAGLTWPSDFTEMSPVGGLSVASIGPNNTEEVTVGPFEWIPNVNVYGHDCVLMIASVAGDPSNIDNFTGAETIAEWRLVPNDNNIGQRNVSLVPGAGGGEALIAALDGAVFFAGNSFNRPASMELRVDMPRILVSKGWRLQFADLDNNKFRLKAGEKRCIQLRLLQGAQFTADELKNVADRNISVYLYGNGILLGGMTYQLDPILKEPSGGKPRPGTEYQGAAEKLLESMKLSSDQKVKKVRVKNIAIDIELDQ